MARRPDDESGPQGKPLSAAVAGFSLHAAQGVQAHDRAARTARWSIAGAGVGITVTKSSVAAVLAGR